MKGRLAAKAAFFGLRNPKSVWIALLLLSALAAASLLFSGFSTDVFRMLPDGSASLRACRALTDSGMFNKATILLTAETPDLFERPETEQALERLLARLMESPDVVRAECRMTPDSLEDAIADLPRFLPQILPFEPLDAERIAASAALRLATGAPSSMTLPDPTGMSMRLLSRLDVFRQVSGIALKEGASRLISPDGLHLMILLETSASPGDPRGGIRLRDHLTRSLRERPVPGARSEFVLPHLHAVENERVLRGDVRAATIASIVIFTLLTLLIFRRDARTLLIPAVACFSAFLMLALTAALFRPALLMIAGMGGVIVGLGVDYGIHIYAATRGSRPLRRLVRIVPPLLLGASTSAAVFLAFLCTPISGMRQLGFFVGASLIACLVLAMTVLPGVFLRKGSDVGARPFTLRPFGWKGAIACLLILLIGVPLLFRPRPLSNDSGRSERGLRAFDMTPESVDLPARRQAEWFQADPERSPSFLLFSGATRDDATAKIPADWTADADAGVFSPTALWPSRAAREANLASWRKGLDIDCFSKELDAAAERAGFASGVFHPFLKRLREGLENPPSAPPELFRPVLDRLTTQGRDGMFHAAVVAAPEAPVTHLLRGTDAACVSQSALPSMLADDIVRSVRIPVLLAIMIAVFFPLICFRSVWKSALAWLPVVAALLTSLSVMAPHGAEVGLAVRIGLIVLAGLALDYGVFILSSRDGESFRHAAWSVTLSALTSLAGGAALLFARHPLLRETGMTLIVGLATAWFVSVFLLPSLIGLRRRAFPQKRETGIDKTRLQDILTDETPCVRAPRMPKGGVAAKGKDDE